MIGWGAIDSRLKRDLSAPQCDFAVKAERLFAYHTLGFVRHAKAGGASAAFAGAPSIYGRGIDTMQAFSRIAPLWGAWIAGGRPASITLPDGAPADLVHLLARGLTHGSDPSHPAYWGDIADNDQRICEAADIALAYWLAHKALCAIMAARDRERLESWLLSAAQRKTADNNWHLFVLLILHVLASLGAGGLDGEAERRWRRLQSFHLGQGWYRDGADGPVDYYNAWAFQYGLFWLSRITPAFEAASIRDNLAAFASQFVYLMTPSGFPAMGRSLDYRMAAPAPLIAAALSGPGAFDAGVAKRALHCIWQYFAQHDALKGGIPTQGFWKRDLRLINNYSGPASSLWSLRGLILALSAARDHPFWQCTEQPLPIETGDFDIVIAAPGWRVAGRKAQVDVTVYLERNRSNPAYPVLPYPAWRAGLDALRGRPSRPNNHLAKYGRYSYNNQRPFWLS